MEGFSKAIGFVFLLLVIVALGGTIFSGTTGLGNTSIFASAPSWVYTLVVLGAAIGIVKIIMPSGS